MKRAGTSATNDELWDRICEVFADTIERPQSEREAFLESKEQELGDILPEVRRLLAEHDTAGHFLEAPAIGYSTAPGLDSERVCQDGDVLAGRFRVVRLLGTGGMGEVYEAFDTQLQDRVAVKMLRGASSVDHKMLDRFRREVLRSRQITHSNVGRVYDLFTHDSADRALPFFTMELLEGETLAHLIEHTGGLAEQAALPLLHGIAAALDAAHQAGIVHRDLKPGNIFVSTVPGGGIKATVTDFGIALETGSSAAATGDLFTSSVSSIFAGTPAYMAPEQLSGEPGSPASDVYSLALVTYEMLTGERAYPEGTALACVLKKLAPGDPFLAELAQVSPRWAQAIQRCIRRNPADRFDTATRFVAALSAGQSSSKPAHSSRRRFLVSGTLAAAALAVIASVRATREWVTGGGVAHASLAVMPFDNSSGDPQMAYFSDGISEELTHAMTSYRDLFVAAQSAAFAFRGKPVSSVDISKALGVDMLLTGSVRRSESRVRVNVELVEGKTGRQVWSQIYDRDLQQIFLIQSDIVREVAARLKLSGGQPDLETAPTGSADAYDLYLQGRHFWNIRTRESLMQGLDCFNQAIQKDPRFALAWTGIADTYSILGEYGWVLPTVAAPKIKEAIDRSLAINPNSAETLVSLGLYNNVFAWDQPGAERAFQRAIALKPSMYLAHSWYGNYLMRASRWGEALQEAEKAQKLDPLSLPGRVFHGWVRYYRREYDRAVEVGKQAVAQDASYPHAHNLLALSYAGAGKIPEALREMEEAFRLTPDHAVGYRYRAVVLSQIPSYEEQARQAAAQIELLSQDRQAGYLAIVYSGIGDRDRAYQWIRRGLELHDSTLHLTIISPQLDRMRSDSRFKELVRQLGYLQ